MQHLPGCFVVMVITLQATLIITVICVAVHFICKFW